MGEDPLLPEDYPQFLGDLKDRIRKARLRAATQVNHELLRLYWEIGRSILERQEKAGWGNSVIERLSRDLQAAFPGSRGWSARNLREMKKLAKAWPSGRIWQTVSAKLSWSHHIVLLRHLEAREDRLWYAARAVENGWSSRVLAHQIEARLHERQGQAVTNFEQTLPATKSDLARQLLKDEYQLGFLGLTEKANEWELERTLLSRVRDFLLELGRGFAFVGSQVPLVVDDETFSLDLLFFHLELRCFVVIELKARRFRPADVGQLGFYLAAADDLLRGRHDGPTIGLVLCRDHSRVIAEYALRDHRQPMGVARYAAGARLPQALAALPSPDEIQKRLKEP